MTSKCQHFKQMLISVGFSELVLQTVSSFYTRQFLGKIVCWMVQSLQLLRHRTVSLNKKYVRTHTAFLILSD